MKLTQKQLILIVGIVTLIVAGGLVGAAWYYNEHKNEVAVTNISEIDGNDSNSDLANYENSTWGFSFQYPADWGVIKDDLPKEVRTPNSPNEDLIIGKDLDGSQTPRPSVILIMNPDGFGPVFPDLKYTIERTNDGFKVINEEVITTDENAEPGFYQIQATEAYNDKPFLIFFSIDDSQKEGWDIAVKGILSTFRFGETQKIDTSD